MHHSRTAACLFFPSLGWDVADAYRQPGTMRPGRVHVATEQEVIGRRHERHFVNVVGEKNPASISWQKSLVLRGQGIFKGQEANR